MKLTDKIDFSRVEWVWLDLDDTLWDFTRNSLSSLALIYVKHRLDRFFPTVDVWRERYLFHNHQLWAQYNVGKITCDFLQRQRFLRPLLEAGCDEKTADRLASVLHVDYLDILGGYPHLIEGARDLLEHFRSKGYHIGVISNGFKEVQYRKLQSSKIENLIECVVLSDEIGVNKPDRRLFEYACRKAGTTPEKSLIVGDNPDTDIAGGYGAGWQTVYFNRDGAGGSAAVPALEIHSLAELYADAIPRL